MHVSILFYERLCDSENPPKDRITQLQFCFDFGIRCPPKRKLNQERIRKSQKKIIKAAFSSAQSTLKSMLSALALEAELYVKILALTVVGFNRLLNKLLYPTVKNHLNSISAFQE